MKMGRRTRSCSLWRLPAYAAAVLVWGAQGRSASQDDPAARRLHRARAQRPRDPSTRCHPCPSERTGPAGRGGEQLSLRRAPTRSSSSNSSPKARSRPRRRSPRDGDLARAGDRQHDRAALQEPGERDLARARLAPLRDRVERAALAGEVAGVERKPRNEADPRPAQ